MRRFIDRSLEIRDRSLEIRRRLLSLRGRSNPVRGGLGDSRRSGDHTRPQTPEPATKSIREPDR